MTPGLPVTITLSAMWGKSLENLNTLNTRTGAGGFDRFYEGVRMIREVMRQQIQGMCTVS